MPISKQRVLELHARLKKKYAPQDGLKMQNEENKHEIWNFVGNQNRSVLSVKSKYLSLFPT